MYDTMRKDFRGGWEKSAANAQRMAKTILGALLSMLGVAVSMGVAPNDLKGFRGRLGASESGTSENAEI